jgi:hypothetical protein
VLADVVATVDGETRPAWEEVSEARSANESTSKMTRGRSSCLQQETSLLPLGQLGELSENLKREESADEWS